MAERMTGYKTEAETVVAECRERLDEAWEYERENREEASIDLAFVAGDQWPEAVRRDREAQRRPMLTINRLPQFLRQVTNDIRQADMSIKAAPVDDNSDPKLAKIYNGIIRQIQYQSSAHHVYATAAEHQAACGIGWFRIVTDYADDTAFDQEIRIESVPHPLSVYCDPAAVKADRSDAMWIIATEMIPTKTFKARYPKASLDGVDTSTDNASSRLYWMSTDGVRVAEYWVKRPYKKLLGLTQDGATLDLTGIKPAERAFLPPIIKEREQTAYKIEHYLVSGAEVLEGPTEWPGKYIPLVCVLGAEVPLDQKTYRSGLIRYARDPQQLYNYYRTATAEMIALAPKSPYLVTTTMVGDEGIKRIWDTHNLTNRPYLPFKPDPSMPGGPRREHPPGMPAALVQEAQIASDDMKATTGIYDASLGQRSNEQSGRAILARQREGDVGTYHFADNLNLSLQHCGRILIDLIPKVYDNERVVRILGDDDAEGFEMINKTIMGVDGVPMVINDLSQARFDVRVTIGPSYSTKRMETAEAMMQFTQAVPQVGQIAPDLIAKALDFPGAEEVAKRLRNMLPPGVLEDPDDPDAPKPPDPMDNPAARIEMADALAKTRKTIAEARKLELETAMMYQTPMLQPEPPLPDLDSIMPQQPPPQGMPPQGMGDPEMGGMPPELANVDPAELQAMIGGLPPGPAEPLNPQF